MQITISQLEETLMPKDRKSVKQATNKDMVINQISLLMLQPNRHLAQTKSTNFVFYMARQGIQDSEPTGFFLNYTRFSKLH